MADATAQKEQVKAAGPKKIPTIHDGPKVGSPEWMARRVRRAYNAVKQLRVATADADRRAMLIGVEKDLYGLMVE